MRKLLTIIFVISIILLFITPQGFAECECDLNSDGSCNGLDWLLFYPDWGRTDCNDPGAERCECDLNGDGSCNGQDWLLFYPDWGRTDCPVGIAAPVPITGQVTSYNTGDDGDYQMGVTWPTPRFEDNTDGTVTDNLTGLIWLKNANCKVFFSGDVAGINTRDWAAALTAANSLSSGYCGLIDGSISGDWRLPNVRELHSLIDFSNYDPALPSGHPFTGLRSNYYWSSTTFAGYTANAWRADFIHGVVHYTMKDYNQYVLPVRGGN